MKTHVIILGCGRSGTSIFGELFEDLPSYRYYSEPDFEELLNFDYKNPVAIKVPRGSKAYPSDPGLSFPLDKILDVIPDPKQFFWIVRHPLDTICSLKVGISKNWGHHPQPLDWKDWLTEPLIRQCAHHWNYLNTIGYQKVQGVVKIKYFEDMIADAEAFAKQICKEVRLSPHEARKGIDYWSGRVQNSNNEKFIEAKTSSAYSTKDHQVRVGRWKENMTTQEYEMVLPIIQKTARFFNYKLD